MNILDRAFHRFAILAATLNLPGAVDPEEVVLVQNSTEELVDSLATRRAVRLYATGVHGRSSVRRAAPKRLEENYLYSSKRFPSATTNTLPVAPNLNVTDNLFFTTARGQRGDSDGYPSGFIETDLQTNMDQASVVPQGKNFVFHQIGISFNAEAKVSDVAILLDSGTLRFIKQGGQFSLIHGPARLWPGGTGVGGLSTNGGVEAAGNGIADIRAVRNLRVPRVIRQNEQFSYSYSVPSAVRSTDGSNLNLSAFTIMTIWLWGGQQDNIPV